MDMPLWAWGGFGVFILFMLALDLGVFHRRPHEVSVKEALIWSAVWVLLALGFNAVVWQWLGPQAGLEFLTGYLVEKALSVDNVFVFVLIFAFFRVPAAYQHKVLFWGVLGALVMRAIFIVVGASLLQTFHWLIYVFGAFLILTGVKMLLRLDRKIDPERNPVVRLFRKIMPVTADYEGDRFFVRRGRLMATPLFLALLFVELTDVIFAVDSIPAILAITADPFIVFTSNVFALLGLRSLYFALHGLVQAFRYLDVGLAAILLFVGGKMVLSDVVKVPVGVSLGVIAAILTVAIVASLLRPRPTQPTEAASLVGSVPQ